MRNILPVFELGRVATQRRTVWADIAWLMLGAALLRLLVFSVTNNESGDPDARALWGALTYESPSPIYSGVWLPLHPYAISILMIPFRDPIVAGKILSLVAGIAAMIPFYFLTSLYFDRRTTVAAGTMFAVYGNHVGLSAVVMSETCFVLLSLWAILCFAREMLSSLPRLRPFLLSALLLAIAGGFRQEAWQLTGILMLWMVNDTRTRRFVIPYALIGFSSYIYWTIGNMAAGHGPLYGLLGVAAAKEVERELIQFSSTKNVVKWVWILVQSPGPLISLLGALGVFLAFSRKRCAWPLATIALLMLAPYWLLSVVKPEWAPQHRYVVLPVILLLPFAAAAFSGQFRRLPTFVPALVALIVISIGTQALAYGRHSKLYMPVKDYRASDIRLWEWLAANLTSGDRMVIEDYDWRLPSIVLRSGAFRLPYEEIYERDPSQDMKKAIERIDATLVVVHSPLSKWPFIQNADHEILFRTDDYSVLRLQPTGSPAK